MAQVEMSAHGKRNNGELIVISFAKLVLALAVGGVLFGQTGAPAGLDEASADFEQGRMAEAGQKLDAILKSHPADLRALVLKAAVLEVFVLHRCAHAPVPFLDANFLCLHFIAPAWFLNIAVF